jgi:hypothetical protein
MSMQSITRRDFVRIGAGAVAAGAAIKSTLLDSAGAGGASCAGGASGRKIRFASIGTGIRGCDLLRSARRCPRGPGGHCGPLRHAPESRPRGLRARMFPPRATTVRCWTAKMWTRSLWRTSDHLHRRVVLDAVAAGKDVYCEKPMSHNVADGLAMVDAVQANKRIFQAGSQRVSNIRLQEGGGDLRLGPAGRGPLIEGTRTATRLPAPGSIPLRPTPARKTIDWEAFCAMRRRGPSMRCASSAGAALPTTARAWRAICLFTCSRAFRRHRHQCAWPAAPTRPAASITSKTDATFPTCWPRSTTIPGHHGESALQPEQRRRRERLIFYGSRPRWSSAANAHRDPAGHAAPQPEGYSLERLDPGRSASSIWTSGTRLIPRRLRSGRGEKAFRPPGYDDTADHIANFFRAIETREHVVEDEVFGNNAAIACHMANYSYFHHNVAMWDAATKTIKAKASRRTKFMSSVSRRTFLQGLQRGCAAACAGAAASPPTRSMPIGLQLYSVRDLLPKDFDETLAKVRAAGYVGGRSGGLLQSHRAEFRKAMDQAGCAASAPTTRWDGAPARNSTSSSNTPTPSGLNTSSAPRGDAPRPRRKGPADAGRLALGGRRAQPHRRKGQGRRHDLWLP